MSKRTTKPQPKAVTEPADDALDDGADGGFLDDSVEDADFEIVDDIPTKEKKFDPSTLSFTPVSKEQTKQQAREIQEKITFPAVPGEVIKFDVFMEWLDILTPEQKEQLEIYQYRTWPLINLRKDDPNADINIAYYTGAQGGQLPDLEQIKLLHGGGHYNFMVCDGTKSKYRKMFEVKLEIDWIEYPPVIPDLSVVRLDSRKNKSYIQYLQKEGFMNERGEVLAQAKVTPRGNEVDSQKLIERLLDKVDTMQQGGRSNEADTNLLLREIFTSSREQQKALFDVLTKGNSSQFDVIKALEALDKIRHPQTQTSGNDNLMATVLTMMVESQKMTNNTMLQILQQQNTAKSDKGGLGVVKELVEILPLLGVKLGGSSGKPEWYELALEHGGPVVSELFATIRQGMALRAQGAQQTAQNPPRQPQRQPQQIPAGGSMAQARARQHQNETQEPESEANMQPTATENTMPEPTQDDLLHMLSSYGNLILQGMLTQDGHHFAVSMLNFLGPNATPAYNLIRKRGAQAVVNVMKSHPGFWATLESSVAGDAEKAALAWVDDFINYEERLQQEENAEVESPEGEK